MSALVDGQLEPELAERAWSHVLHCRACRRLVEQEGKVKRELAMLAGNEPSANLLGSLYSLDGTDRTLPSWDGLDAWAAVDEIERRTSGRRRAGIALVGAGSVAAVFGFASLSGATLGIGSAPANPPATSLSRSSPAPAPTTAAIAPAVSVHGRIPISRENPGVQRSVVLLEQR